MKEVGRLEKPPGRIYQLTIELLKTRPLVWRTILVPGSLRLIELDRVVQAVIGWKNGYLHEWRIGGIRYGFPESPHTGYGGVQNDSAVTLSHVVGADVDEFDYCYDVTCGWEHRIKVDRRFEFDDDEGSWPVCIGGANACPPEDVGGPLGYTFLLDAIDEPDPEAHRPVARADADRFDPKAFGIQEANRAIQRLR